jgi:hypothetical protein
MIEKPQPIAIVFLNNVRGTKSEAISTVHNKRFHEREKRSFAHKASDVSQPARCGSRGATIAELVPKKLTNWNRARPRSNEKLCFKHSSCYELTQRQNATHCFLLLYWQCAINGNDASSSFMDVLRRFALWRRKLVIILQTGSCFAWRVWEYVKHISVNQY